MQHPNAGPNIQQIVNCNQKSSLLLVRKMSQPRLALVCTLPGVFVDNEVKRRSGQKKKKKLMLSGGETAQGWICCHPKKYIF